jgi:hypothetical protein
MLSSNVDSHLRWEIGKTNEIRIVHSDLLFTPMITALPLSKQLVLFRFLSVVGLILFFIDVVEAALSWSEGARLLTELFE